MIYDFEFELELDNLNCEFTIPLDSKDVGTLDGYDYQVNIDVVVTPVLDGEDPELRTEVQGIIESRIAEDEDLADFRAEIDEAHNIVHEADGIPSLYDINERL